MATSILHFNSFHANREKWIKQEMSLKPPISAIMGTDELCHFAREEVSEIFYTLTNTGVN